MRKIIILFIVTIVYSCQKKNDEVILNKDFKAKLTHYIEVNPIGTIVKGAPKPLYQVFFEQRNTDTIISIKLVPHLIPYSPIDYQKSQNNSEVLTEVDHIGYFLMNKIPIAVFDSNDYSRNIITKGSLKKSLSDDYKFDIGEVNNHINSSTIYYKLSNNKLEEVLYN